MDETHTMTTSKKVKCNMSNILLEHKSYHFLKIYVLEYLISQAVTDFGHI